MTEYTLYRHNPGIDPSMHVWGWEIPVYLFLGGLVAGLMIIAGVRLLIMRPNARQALVCCTVGPLAGLALLSLGMLALFLDLSHKVHVWRLYLTFEPTSPMSWGSWILLLVYPALLANALAHLPEAIPSLSRRFPVLVRISDFMLARPRIIVGTGLANIVLGLALGMYTGILLGALGARPLWNSAVLGPLFLLSMVARWSQAGPLDKRIAPTLAQADNSFLTIELALLGLLLIGHLTSTAVHQEAAGLLLHGPYAAVFWVCVIGLGILLPLLLQHLELLHRIRHTIAPSVLVLCGGLVLRFVIVAAGQASHWSSVLP
jgi:protein NrfD